jgi:hypothetical protein
MIIGTLLVSGCTMVVRHPVMTDVAKPVLGMGRISYSQGQAQIQFEGDQEWSLASVNVPVREGDRYWTPAGARLELQFQDGTALRLDGETSVDVLRMDQNLLQVHLASGSLYFHAGRAAGQIDLEDGTIVARGEARFHADRLPDNGEEISVFRGSIQVTSNDEQITVRANERLVRNNDSSEISPLNQPTEWESWNSARDRIEDAGHRAYLAPELAVYAGELDENGDWIHTDYGYCWRPRVDNGGWAPYRSGRWTYINGDYVWVSYERWGWAPYHYGRWVWTPEGWCWVPPAPGNVYWGPGYVGWMHTSMHECWVPLAPREVYYGYGYYGHDSINLSERPNAVVRSTYQYGSMNQAVSGVPHNDFATVHAMPVQMRANEIAPGTCQAIGRPLVKAGTPLRIGPPAPVNALPKPALRTLNVAQFRANHPQVTAAGSHATPMPVKQQAAASKNNVLPAGRPNALAAVSNTPPVKAVAANPRIVRQPGVNPPKADARARKQNGVHSGSGAGYGSKHRDANPPKKSLGKTKPTRPNDQAPKQKNPREKAASS